MEITKEISKLKLVEIRKTSNSILLTFEKPRSKKQVQLIFKGLIFETSSFVLNKKVERVELIDILGFKAVTQLKHLGKNPKDYKQLLIKMSGSSEEYKTELICVFKDYQLEIV